jgi:hypothetical protein
MTIAETREKCKSIVDRLPRDILIISILIFASLASFGLGYLAGQDADRAAGQGSSDTFETVPLPVASTSEQVVASKTGTKYYEPTCAGVARIPDANKVWFATPVLAQAAGYTPAAHCTGL